MPQGSGAAAIQLMHVVAAALPAPAPAAPPGAGHSEVAPAVRTFEGWLESQMACKRRADEDRRAELAACDQELGIQARCG